MTKTAEKKQRSLLDNLLEVLGKLLKPNEPVRVPVPVRNNKSRYKR